MPNRVSPALADLPGVAVRGSPLGRAEAPFVPQALLRLQGPYPTSW